MSNIKSGIDIEVNIDGAEQVKALSREFEQMGQAGKDIDKLSQSVEKANQSLSDTVEKLAQSAAAVAALKEAATASMELETALAGVRKVTGATDQEIGTLKNELKDLSVEVGVSAAKMAEMAAFGGQLGLPVEQLKEFAVLSSQMSVAFGMTAEEAGKAAATIKNVFALETIDQVRTVSDAINQLGNNTAATEKAIAEALSRVGGSARQFGLTAQEAAALSAAFISLGKTPEIASTAINSLLNKLQTAQIQGKDFQAALNSIGLSANDMARNIAENPQKAITGFLNAISQLDAQTRSLTIAQMFGAEYADDIALLVGGLKEYQNALNQVADQSSYAGATAEEHANAMSTTAQSITNAKIAIENLLSSLGDNFAPVISGIAGGVEATAKAVTALTEQFPHITQLISLLAGWKLSMIAISGSLKALGLQGVLSMGQLKTGFQGATMAVNQLGMAMTTTAAKGALFKTLGADLQHPISALKNMKASVGALNAAMGALMAWDVGSSIGKALYEKSDTVAAFGDWLGKGIAYIDAALTDRTIEDVERLYMTKAEMAKADAIHQQNQANALKELENQANQTAESLNNVAVSSVDAGLKIGEAFQSLGVDVGLVTTGISKDAEKAFHDFANASQLASEDVENQAKLIQAGFDAVFHKLKTHEELTAFKNQLQETGDWALLTADQMGQLSAAIEYSGMASQDAYAKGGSYQQAYEQGLNAIKNRVDDVSNAHQNMGNNAQSGYEQAISGADQLAEANHKIADSYRKSANETQNVSVITNHYYDSAMRAVTQYRLKLFDASQMSKEAAENLREALQKMNGGAYKNATKANIQRYVNDLNRASKAAENLQRKTQNGTVSMNDIAGAASAAHSSIAKLDSATLNNLNSAIDAARNKLKDARDEAVQTRQALQEELDELNGEKSSGNSNKIKELQQKRREAAISGDSKAEGEYMRAISIQRQIEAKKKSKENQQLNQQKEVNINEQDILIPNTGNLKLSGVENAASAISDAISGALETREKAIMDGILPKLVDQIRQSMRSQGLI